jgi:hypothetical protein
MAVTFTTRQIIDQAASKVGILGAGQALAAVDLAKFQELVDCLFDQLEQDEIVSFADPDTIPGALAPYLATLLANMASPDYGAPTDLGVKEANEAVIRRLVRGTVTYELQTPDYF